MIGGEYDVKRCGIQEEAESSFPPQNKIKTQGVFSK